MTLSGLKTRIKTQLRADLASGSLAVYDLHDDSIAQWANEEAQNVILMYNDPVRLKSLYVFDSYVEVFGSSGGTLPTDYILPVTFKTGDDRIRARILTGDDFARIDSKNFVLEPTSDNPVCAFVGNKVYVKPTASYDGYLDYIKAHPTITAVVNTSFDSIGDNILVQLVLSRYYDFMELPDMSVKAIAHAKDLANVNKQGNN